MARISEVAKEYAGADGKALKSSVIIEALTELGVEKKTASSSFPEEHRAAVEAALAKAGFRKSPEGAAAEPGETAPKAEAPAPAEKKDALKQAEVQSIHAAVALENAGASRKDAPAVAIENAKASDADAANQKEAQTMARAAGRVAGMPKAGVPKAGMPKAGMPKPGGPKAGVKAGVPGVPRVAGKNGVSVSRPTVTMPSGAGVKVNTPNPAARPAAPQPRGPIKPRENMIDRAALKAAEVQAKEEQEREAQIKKEEQAAAETAPVNNTPAAEAVSTPKAPETAAAAPEHEQAAPAPAPAPQGAPQVSAPQRAQIPPRRQFATVVSRPTTPQQRPASRPGYGQGSYGQNNYGGNRPGGYGGNRPGGQNGRPGTGGPGGRGGSFSAPAAAPAGGNDRNRRNKHAEKDRDRASKRESMYEDNQLGKGRNSNAGRFIKPVKKQETVEDDIKVIILPDMVTIKELAEKMRINPSEIVKKLFLQGEMVTVNQEIPFEKAEEIAIDYEIMCEHEEKIDVIAELLKEEEEDESKLVPRPPVICVMGHVDHGKTSLLDAIRKTNVTDKEAGGITQHIGAYTVTAGDRQITFLDTPGHEAFTAMRMRGANSTDIAILVVAADDGVMPQTVEAINHAKAAGIEIIVAVNKIDKPGANIDRVKQELTEYELIPEDWGGQTIFVPVSAKTGQGIEDLLEMILLTADVLELKANPKRQARGLVIEAQLDKGRGPVATVLVQKGTLHAGDFISAGVAHGKVRAMVDDKGRRVKEAGPSTPVEIIGLDDVPNAGEIFICHENEKEAKNYADTFIAQNKEKLLEDTKAKMSLDDLFSKIKEGNLKELNLIIKADVQGSVEAVRQSLTKLSNEEVVVKVIHGGVGAINESDVVLASASNAIIIGFNVRPDVVAKQTAEREGVDVRLYKVIYQAIEDVEAAMKGMLDPVFEEKIIGHAEVRQIFKASAVGNIAGSFVLDGVFQRGCKIRITREGEQIYEGALASLKRFKDDVKEVKAGFECGLVFEGFDQMQELDLVEAYIMVEVPR